MFQKGNKLSKGRPKGSFNEATKLKNYLVKLLLNNKEALKAINPKELLRCIAPLLPKEQTIHQDTEPITINIDTKKDEKLTIESNTPTNARLTDEVLNSKVNEIKGDMLSPHRTDNQEVNTVSLEAHKSLNKPIQTGSGVSSESESNEINDKVPTSHRTEPGIDNDKDNDEGQTSKKINENEISK